LKDFFLKLIPDCPSMHGSSSTVSFHRAGEPDIQDAFQV
jgi:hypothetical protein